MLTKKDSFWAGLTIGTKRERARYTMPQRKRIEVWVEYQEARKNKVTIELIRNKDKKWGAQYVVTDESGKKFNTVADRFFDTVDEAITHLEMKRSRI